MMSCPAIRARSRWGRTVWPNPTMPGKGSWPARIMASRLSLISSLTPRYVWPLARSAPRVAGAGWLLWGCWLCCCTIRQYVVFAGLYYLPCSGRGRRVREWVAHFHPVATTQGTVSSDDVAAARALIGDVISDTPVLHSRVLSETVAGPVFLKCENLQRTGSFKVRGAYFRIARLSDAERARGVVAASAGNHAQGVAFAAGRLGCAATVVMPAGAPLPKVLATRGYGADVILHGTSVEDDVPAAPPGGQHPGQSRSEEHTSELPSQANPACRLLLEKKSWRARGFRASASLSTLLGQDSNRRESGQAYTCLEAIPRAILADLRDSTQTLRTW